ncbi:MAG: 30S ribosomal protein S4 [Candidatus Krumholzibacteria bacterium]|jgi:small subunit ribosomal protein S4|nr:30S ribosomal protein S4 [Candidatus Krumholzibacteria bacterium]MDP6670090.1 30S ribosomal protein S4 [Candidatus Krumholzibacteria bacterium]MDP6796641.1 30S ribosomal protein S4 [Candidatus Krumholzibacteria bacterium]MDP7022047.1 30S ribosomal protein S4 [Candidatus Krumholzibacteria bacterium]
MARYHGPRWKLSRRFGESIFDDYKALERRPYPPGQHGRGRRRKVSEYGIQLTEKQKLRYLYGVLEKPFRNYFAKAASMKGVTGTNLLQLLEARLDNMVYRMGFAPTRRMARQLVGHRHFLVNGKLVDIPSYRCKPGDVVSLREKSRKNAHILEAIKNSTGRGRVSFVSLDEGAFEGTFVNVPERTDIPTNVQEQLVVELYSK